MAGLAKISKQDCPFQIICIVIFYHMLTRPSSLVILPISDMATALLEQNQIDLVRPPKIGETMEGIIVGFSRAAVYLDLGAIGAGIIYGREFYLAKDALRKLKIGDKLFAKVVDLENDEGYIEMSITQAGRDLSWDSLKEKKEGDSTIQVKILGANKGGLLADVDGVAGFLPVSQLKPEHYPRVENADRTQILQKLQTLVGQTIEVKILDLNPRREVLILSERATEDKKIKEILKNYKVGDVVEGEITGIVDFGAFMKFGEEGLEGLIHISELDWKLIDDPTEVVKVGEKIKAKIIEITDGGRVSLSLRALKTDPWAGIETKYQKNDLVGGKVTKFNIFGAFVEIAPKIQGLVHISEFGTRTKMEEKLKIGSTYNFSILQVDPKEHRMSLKLSE